MGSRSEPGLGTEPRVPSPWGVPPPAPYSGEVAGWPGAVPLERLAWRFAVTVAVPEASRDHDRDGGHSGRCHWGEGQTQRLLFEDHVSCFGGRNLGGWGRQASVVRQVRQGQPLGCGVCPYCGTHGLGCR